MVKYNSKFKDDNNLRTDGVIRDLPLLYLKPLMSSNKGLEQSGEHHFNNIGIDEYRYQTQKYSTTNVEQMMTSV
jgi:hypothetical protein